MLQDLAILFSVPFLTILGLEFALFTTVMPGVRFFEEPSSVTSGPFSWTIFLRTRKQLQPSLALLAQSPPLPTWLSLALEVSRRLC